MIDGITVQGFQMEYPVVSLELKDSNEKLYDYYVLNLYTLECERGFKVKKIYKTTRKGTKVMFEAFKSEDDVKEYGEFLKEKMEIYNKKWNENVKLDS